MNLNFILQKPIITEKTSTLASQSKFVFACDPAASKGQIKEAISKTYSVTVLGINTTIIKGKKRRAGRSRRTIQNPSYKKAIVTLKKGDKIDIFETKETK